MSPYAHQLVLKALCASVVYTVTAHAQAPTATLGVRANVPPACATSTLDYGVLDFGSHGAINNQIQVTSSVGAGTILLTCVEGLTYSVKLGEGLYVEGTQRYMHRAAGGKIRYQLFSDSQFAVPWNIDTLLTQVGTGVEQQIPLYGRIPPQDTANAGTYNDTVSVTIEW